MTPVDAPTGGRLGLDGRPRHARRRPERQPARDLLPELLALRRGRLQRRRLDDHRTRAPAAAPGRRPRSRKRSRCSASPAPRRRECVLVGSAGARLHLEQPDRRADRLDADRLPDRRRCARSPAAPGSLCVASAFRRRNLDHQRARRAVPPPGPRRPAGRRKAAARGQLLQRNALRRRRRQRARLERSRRRASAWPTTPLPRRFQIVAAYCPSPTLCILSCNNGEVTAAGNPVGGPQAWLTEHLIKGVTNALFGLSCPTEILCVAAGKFGQILTTTQPTATGLPNRRRRPHRRPPSSATRRRQTIHLGVHTPVPTVAFRFKGQGTGPFWFRCKLDSQPRRRSARPRGSSASGSASTPSASAPSAPAAAATTRSSTASRSNGRSRSRNRRPQAEATRSSP